MAGPNFACVELGTSAAALPPLTWDDTFKDTSE